MVVLFFTFAGERFGQIGVKSLATACMQGWSLRSLDISGNTTVVVRIINTEGNCIGSVGASSVAKIISSNSLSALYCCGKRPANLI